MELSVEIKLDPKLERLLERAIEATRDLASVIGALTGLRVIDEEE